MASYIVSYDLLRPGQNYDDLYKALRSFPKWGRVNESVWVVVTPATAVQVRDNLLRYLDANDRLFVVKSGAEAAWRNAKCEGTWLKENL